MRDHLKQLLTYAGRRLRRTPLAKSRLLNDIHTALSLRLHRSNSVRVGPFTVRFDPSNRWIAKNLILYGGYEEVEIRLLCSMIQPGDHVVDVGANIGVHTMHFSRAVGEHGKVVAVEPDVQNLQYLRENMQANRCTNVTVVPYAVGAETGQVTLYLNESNRGQNSLADVSGTGVPVNIPMRRTEDVIDEQGVQPKLVKIDVEGYEPFVIRGLGMYKPDIIMFEFNVDYIESFEVGAASFLESLVAEGYSLALIEEDGRTRDLTPADAITLWGSTGIDQNILATRRGV